MFAYRGFLLDSARHMQSVAEIEKLADALAALGFNRLHWHLTDDQGWRFGSERFPALNTAAAVRPYSDFGKTREDAPYGRVYTKAEMREIVAYCAERGIEVVPEFDMPGHTSALLAAYPALSCAGEAVKIKTHQGIFQDVLCLAKEETFETVTGILDEICEVFPGEFIHIGGDETPAAHWKACPACRRRMRELGVKSYAAYQNCFMNRVTEHLAQKGRRSIVWNDAVKGGNLDKRAVIQYWKEGDRASVRFINEGGSAILSPFSYCYLDYDYAITPLNRVLQFRPTLRGLTKAGEGRILGVEATLWTEYIRDDRTLERLAFPRAVAVAKIARGEPAPPYGDFLREVKKFRAWHPEVAFGDEWGWKHSRFEMPRGWIGFLKEHCSKDYLREQVFGKNG